MSLAPEAEWLYLRIFPGSIVQSGDAPQELERSADHLLAHCLLPTLRQLDEAGTTKGYFFIRYAEDGYHLRVRCRGLDEKHRAAARDALLAALDAYLPTRPGSFPGARDSADLVSDGRLRDSVYDPELDKYGGRDALNVVEAHFRGCTDLTAAVLALDDQGLKRDHLALWLMGQTLHALDFEADAAAALLTGYARYWMPATGNDMEQASATLEQDYSARQRLVAGLLPNADGNSVYARTFPQVERQLGWVRGLFRATVERLRALEQNGRLHSSWLPLLQHQTIRFNNCRRYPLTHLVIIPNLIHMMNNRIAVNVRTEAKLAYFMARAYAGDASAKWHELPVMLQPAPLHSNPAAPPTEPAQTRVQDAAWSHK